jgi:hypothetical protein
MIFRRRCNAHNGICASLSCLSRPLNYLCVLAQIRALRTLPNSCEVIFLEFEMERSSITNPDQSAKDDCFVVSPIGDAGSATRKHADMVLNSIIRPIAACPDFDFIVSRADEISDPGMINDQVILKITTAKLVIADLSFLNPNVFYEIGLRHATGKPIIHMASNDTRLPFDTLGYRCLGFDVSDWHSQEATRRALSEAIKATRAPNYKVSNPLTQARALIELSQSADSSDKTLLDALRRIEKLERGNTPSAHKNIRQYNDFCNLVVRERAADVPSETAMEALRHYLEKIGGVGTKYFEELRKRSELSSEQIAELQAIAEAHNRITDDPDD